MAWQRGIDVRPSGCRRRHVTVLCCCGRTRTSLSTRAPGSSSAPSMTSIVATRRRYCSDRSGCGRQQTWTDASPGSTTLRYSLLIPRIDYAEVLTADTRSTAVLSVTTFSVTVLLIVVYPCFATYWNVYKGACRRSQNGRSSWR